MILKEDNQKLQLITSKRYKIKYILLLLVSSSLFFFFCLSVIDILFRSSLNLGNTLSDLLTQLTFLIGGNIIFVGSIILAIYGSVQNILKSREIIFDKINRIAVFFSKRRIFKKDIAKTVPFSEISKIEIKQEEESEYITLSVSQKEEKILVDSDYGLEGMERLNELAENIHKILRVPLKKGVFEDIYKVEEEENNQGNEIKKDKQSN